MTPEHWLEHDATNLARLVSTGEAQPDELLDAALARAERVEPAIHAIAHRFVERAREHIARGLPAGPFRGVPFLLKDQLDLAGTPMSFGSALLDGYHCEASHPLATRLEGCGFAIFGRTNMSELGMTPTTEPLRYGPTCNPWNPDFSAGGSSGGAAAAVAAGIVPMAYGADGGGSIRIPAAACGLFGLKPSRGRNPWAPADDPDGFVVHHGISRTVRDSAALLDATCGAAPSARWRLPPPERPYAQVCAEDPAAMRIGLVTRGIYGEPLHPDALAGVERAAALCEHLGHHVEEVEAPVDPEALTEAFRALWVAAAGVFYKLAQREIGKAKVPRWLRGVLRHPGVFRAATALPQGGAPRVEPFTRRLARVDAASSASDLWLAQVAMEQAAARLADWFGGHDLLLTTTLTRPPIPLGTLELGGTEEEIARRMFGYIAFTPLANATGLPAMSVPMGLSLSGLPRAAHFMAAAGREDQLFALAGQLEREAPWGSPPEVNYLPGEG